MQEQNNWMHLKNTSFNANEVVGIQILAKTFEHVQFSVSLFLRGGAEIKTFGDDAREVWSAFNAEAFDTAIKNNKQPIVDAQTDASENKKKKVG